jgi:DNA-binding NtrC family response regulator
LNDAKRRVLVVEDESAQRLMYTRALKQFGYESQCAENSTDALALLASNPIAIVLLDLNLSGEHGMDLFEQIRELYPAISVVIATGYGTFEIAKRAIKMDLVDFLSKPVSLTELESALERAWARYVLVQSPAANLLPPEEHDTTQQQDSDPIEAPASSLNIESMERDYILKALRQSQDNRKVAARMLGISERKLYYKLSQYRMR